MNIGEIELEAIDGTLTIVIPAYTNYSKEDYGIKIVVPYSADLEIKYPELPENADLTVTNITQNGSPVTKFPTGSYSVDANCDIIIVI